MAFVRHVTLVGSVVSTVTFTGNESRAQVINRSAVEAFCTLGDATNAPAAPTVAGNDCDLVPGVIGGTLELRRQTSQPMVIKLISTGTPSLTVRGIP